MTMIRHVFRASLAFYAYEEERKIIPKKRSGNDVQPQPDFVIGVGDVGLRAVLSMTWFKKGCDPASDSMAITRQYSKGNRYYRDSPGK